VRRWIALGMAAIAAAVLPAAGQAAARPKVFVFNGEGNRLNAYDHATGRKQTVIWAASDPEKGDGREHRDLNAQICFHEHEGRTFFIAGEDTAQGDAGDPGWGWFELFGDEVQELRTQQRGKLVPTYSNTADNPENYGCGFLDDGRLVTGDVGDQLPQAPATGQLIVWFPDSDGGFDEGFSIDGNVPRASDLDYCKIDRTLPTAGGIWVDRGNPATPADDAVYIATARPDLPSLEYGIFRYTGIGAIAGCTDSERPLVEVPGSGVRKELFIRGGSFGLTPSAIVPSGRGSLFVSSVFDGNVAEYRPNGTFKRHVAGTPPFSPIALPTGQITGLLPEPLLVGTPFGIGVTPDGTLYYAEIGVLGPGPTRAGHLMKVRFTSAGLPLPPEVVDDGLAFPDGIGVLVVNPPR
jgi:hypothetical protein